MARDGAAVFMCTHILDMAEKLCTQVGIISGGRLIAKGTVDEIRSAAHSGKESSLEDIFLKLTNNDD